MGEGWCVCVWVLLCILVVFVRVYVYVFFQHCKTELDDADAWMEGE